ncbi:PAS domain-containing sensor histidine kinase [Gloeothece verrucosa]|uniref:histidine kinase n=1 Tax=Gloeothece verrucosa (strain PCC 7822) TaxID=497965 RepID=E0U948_GLOV7|nr:PAS domain-containing protein [Gloeothece verrucosa]ADN17306.1 PAS/PAC sensor signal transduction histidine kinase [Gloeothece verrucosa PCC 7822]
MNNEVILLIPEGRDLTDSKALQEKLRECEERWQLAVQVIEHGHFDWNILSGETYQSPKLKAMLGYDDHEISNDYHQWQSLIHPEDLHLVNEKIRAYLERKSPHYVAEYRMRCKNNTYKSILATGQAKWDDNGQAVRMVGFYQDLSQQKQVRAEMEPLNPALETGQSLSFKGLFQDIVENIQMGLLVWHLEDPNDLESFRLIAANPAANQLIGKPLENCLGQRFVQCFPRAFTDNSVIIEAHAEVIRTRQAQAIPKFSYTQKDEPSKILTLKLFPLPNNCVGTAFEDITQQRQTEKALVESTRRYRLVVNSVKEIIFQTDLSGCWSFLNPAWTEITGYTVMESLNCHFSNFIFAPEDQQHCQEMFQALIKGEQEIFQAEFRCQTRDGNFRWLEMTAQLHQDEESDTYLGALGTINDITERKRTEAILQARAGELTRLNAVLLATTAQLEKRNQELDQFAYVASHDLKAPLRAIANLSVWIEEDIKDQLDEDTRHQMELLRGRVHRMEALINGLLQYSRVGRLKGQTEVINVGELLTEIVDSLAPPSEFRIEIVEPMPTLVTESFPLRQVLTNLISNALKHHHNNEGNIQISVEEKEEFYQFSITDDGPGIDPQYHEKIFGIFQTLEARDKTENTGIGLSIVKKTVESQKGKIWVDSKLGDGTTFRFTWPKTSISIH